METRYKIRIALTVLVAVGGPIFYGLADPSLDARFTLAAAMSIPLILGWVLVIGLVGSAIEWVVRLLLKR